MLKTVKMDLEYLPTIDHAPQSAQQLHNQAASNDDPTIEAWRDIWIKNFKENHRTNGPFCDNPLGEIYGEAHLKSAIVVGSGPSLANNVETLATAGDIPILSCLHNFHYMVDHNVPVNYFVTLDAGEVTIEEISEGGKHDHEYYLEKTKDFTLLAFVGSSPNLIKSWRGKILWFNCPIPDERTKQAFDETEVFHNYTSNGGNVLGSCVYIAKAYMGASTLCYVGADFAFGYTKNFHPWPSKYDGKLGRVVTTNDCWGNKVYTWQSYANFKGWHESITMRCPGEWINCTEGGTFGVYPNGLIRNIKHKPLKEFLDGCLLYKAMEFQANNPKDANEDLGVPGVPPQPKLFF
jgi:hypothetical protein